MNNLHYFLPFLLFLILNNAFSSQSDTTYGSVQTTDKTKPSPIPQSDYRDKKEHDDENDTCSLWSQLFGGMAKAFFEGLYCMYVKPVILIASGDQFLSNPEHKTYFLYTFGNAFILYPHISAGFQFQFDVSDLINLTTILEYV